MNEDIESNGINHFFLIVKDGDKIVGTIAYAPKDTFTNGKLEDCVRVGAIYIHPSYQGKGLGNRLINLITIELQKKNITEFCLDSGFKTSQKIWIKKFGNPEYHLKDYWDEGVDHMIWKVRIKDVLA